jgi:hypothetical protein
VFCRVKNVLPTTLSLTIPVWPKIVAPRRYLLCLIGTNAPTAQRHSSPMPRPSPLWGDPIRVSGRKSIPVCATSVTGTTTFTVYSPLIMTSAVAEPSPPKLEYEPVGK